MLLMVSYLQFSKSLYQRYDTRLAEVLNYVDQEIDADDMEQCLQTGKVSKTYQREQQFLNGFVDPMELAYLYIVIPDPEKEVMINAISATSNAERAAGETDMPLLEINNAYDTETLTRFKSVWDAKKINYFEEDSDYGAFYTACKPLRNSKHETVALICADIPIDDLHRTVHFYMLMCAGMILLIGAAFGVALMIWLRRNIIRPISELEQSARNFAANSHRLKDNESISAYQPPDIRTGNEVQGLSETITKMSTDMQDYVHTILNAEARAESAEQEAENMTILAFQDALTHVKSKAAYDQMIEDLDREIADEENAEFAILMIDLNDLKKINDTYGHENGDKYLIGSCRQICEIYVHSPVFRIGGDEFAVLLRGRDYRNREALFRELDRRFSISRSDMDRQPWERYSAAAGMAEFGGQDGETIEEVFRKADERMYEDKQRMKEKGLT